MTGAFCCTKGLQPLLANAIISFIYMIMALLRPFLGHKGEKTLG
jgi:hypothetical protein